MYIKKGFGKLRIKRLGYDEQELGWTENNCPFKFSGRKMFNVAGNKKIGFLGAFQKFVVFRIAFGGLEANRG